MSQAAPEAAQIRTSSMDEAAYYLLSGLEAQRIECRWVEAAGILCTFVYDRVKARSLLAAYLDGSAVVKLKAFLAARSKIRAQMWAAQAAYMPHLEEER